MFSQNSYPNGDLKQNQVVVLMVPFPAHGHINQLIHFSHILTTYGIEVHCAGSTTHNHQAKLRIHGWNFESSKNIHFHDFHLEPLESSPRNPYDPIKFPAHLEPLSRAVSELRRPVYRLLQELSGKFRRVVIVHDNLMASVVQDVKLVENAESYTFLSVSAFTVFFSKWESILEKPFELDLDVSKSIPCREGCFTLEFEKFIVNEHKLLAEFESGRLFNTSRVIEGKYMELLSKLQTNPSKKLFAIGPFNPIDTKVVTNGSRHRCLDWLDKQEKDSVIYISFGSMTPMSNEQITELAIGLDESEQKFIWVLRDADGGGVLDDDEVMKTNLPDGNEHRWQNRGIVVRDWAPQLEILGHPATGGFLSHCGWSSCMESVTMGVPIAAWPMHSDQPKNSILVTQVLRIGTLIRDWDDRGELIRSNTIRDAIIRLMKSNVGDEMRKRAVELGVAVRESMSVNGCSRLELESFIGHISR